MKYLPQNTNCQQIIVSFFAFVFLVVTSDAQEVESDLRSTNPSIPRDSSQVDHGGRRFGLIIVGLPGDRAHAAEFNRLVQEWSKSLKKLAGVKEERLFILSGQEEDEHFTGTTGEQARAEIDRLTEQLGERDSLWVFFLGHGSHDDQHAWFHLPGPDMHEGEWAGLFARIQCREQVFWITQAASGGFVRAFSRANRIIIAATEPAGELNETRFPQVLSKILKNPDAKMDLDGDGKLSVLELFLKTNADVASSFEEKQLAATEHAQLDDNGDGKGSEADGLIKPRAEQTDATVPQLDGALAAKIFVTTTFTQPKRLPTIIEKP